MTPLLAWLPLFSALMAVPPVPLVVISNAPACPAVATLSAALAGMLPARSDAEGPDVLQVTGGPGDDGLDVRLSDTSGLLIGAKRLPGAGSCNDRAQAVAVLVAAWETHWRPDAPMSLPRAQAEEKPSPPPAPVTVATPPASVVRRPEPRPVTLEVETRAGLLASIAGGTVAPAVTCDAGFGTRGGRFAVAVGALGVGNHDAPVGAGSVRWRRLGGTIDLRARLPLSGALLEMHAAAALTALSLGGESLPRTERTTMFDPGALIGLRGRFPVAQLMPWLEATAAIWPVTRTAYVTGTEAQRELPSLEVLLGAGVSFGAAPPAPVADADE